MQYVNSGTEGLYMVADHATRINLRPLNGGLIKLQYNWPCSMFDGKQWVNISTRDFHLNLIDTCSEVSNGFFAMKYDGNEISILSEYGPNSVDHIKAFKDSFPEFPYIAKKLLLEDHLKLNIANERIKMLEDKIDMLMGHVEALLIVTGNKKYADDLLDPVKTNV